MTSTQRNRLITFGVWDLLHSGHIKFINSCASVSNDIIVGVQSDRSVYAQKGYYPIIGQDSRADMVLSIKNVNKVFVYDDFEYEKYAKEYGCTHLALSETNRHSDRFLHIKQYVRMTEGNIYYFDYDTTVSSTAIKNTITNNWHSIWDNVGKSDKDDYEITGHDEAKTKQLGEYITNKINLQFGDSILDYGCGSGVLLNELNCYRRFGIDISTTMLERALKFNRMILINSNKISLINKVKHIISWGVLHYLPDLKFVDEIISSMKSLSNDILLMELPDIDKRDSRIANRIKIGKNIHPEPLYFCKQWFVDRGFVVSDTELKVSDNSDFSFTAYYNNKS